MNYYLDQEFIEGFKKPLFDKRRHFIDLISIGISCEDDREYYAISNEFDPSDADELVRKNVLSKLVMDYVSNEEIADWDRTKASFLLHYFGINTAVRYVQSQIGKSLEEIAQDIREFVVPYYKLEPLPNLDTAVKDYLKNNPPKFYGWYADYDWVLFCSLFGRMIDLPKGFPMYCNDLKQTSDEVYEKKKSEYYADKKAKGLVGVFINELKNHPDYPRQTNEHHALSDARWNKALHEFIQKI